MPSPHLSMARKWHASNSRRPVSVQQGLPKLLPAGLYIPKRSGEGDGAGTEPMSPPLSPPRHLRGQNPTNTSDLQWKDVSPPDPKEQSPCFLPSPKEGRRSAVAPDPRSTGRWTAPDLKRQVSSSHIPHSLSPEGRCLHLRTAAGAPDLRAGRYFSERETRGAGPRVGVP